MNTLPLAAIIVAAGTTAALADITNPAHNLSDANATNRLRIDASDQVLIQGVLIGGRAVAADDQMLALIKNDGTSEPVAREGIQYSELPAGITISSFSQCTLNDDGYRSPLSDGGDLTIRSVFTDSSTRILVLNPALYACGQADLGSIGGTPGYDGVFDNNDFIVFIDLFFGGCP